MSKMGELAIEQQQARDADAEFRKPAPLDIREDRPEFMERDAANEAQARPATPPYIPDHPDDPMRYPATHVPEAAMDAAPLSATTESIIANSGLAPQEQDVMRDYLGKHPNEDEIRKLEAAQEKFHGGPAPPELPEVRALRLLIQNVASANAALAGAVELLNAAGQTRRFDQEIGEAYGTARVLIHYILQGYGFTYTPPGLPRRDVEPVK